MMAKRAMSMADAAAAPAPGFSEKSFFEFHLYTLERPTTLSNNSTKQIELFDQARQIPAKKVLLYYGLGQSYFYPNPVTDRRRPSSARIPKSYPVATGSPPPLPTSCHVKRTRSLCASGPCASLKR